MLGTDQILEALKGVRYPAHRDEEGGDIVSLGMVSGVQVSPSGDVVFVIEVDPERGGALEPMRQEAERIVSALVGVGKVSAVLTAEKTYTPPSSAQASTQTGQSVSSSGDPHGMAKNPVLDLPIKRIIAVASGKGGVGKSTVALALARGLAKNSQLRIGLLDADIYGPSQPKLTGLEGVKPVFTAGEKIDPPVVAIEGNPHGLKIMSIGFMVDAEQALIWRGPMVQSALYQLFRDVEWGGFKKSGLLGKTRIVPLDILIVDMPPGTGDAQLTLAQKISVDGVVIVSTPQDLALIDARRGVEMFRKTGVPILGLIENMSTHICTQCGHEEHIFGHGGARAEAERLGIEFLGEVPLSADLRAKADEGAVFDFPVEIVERVLEG